MKCPKCKNQLPRDFFESSYDFSTDLRCCNCNFKITRKIINANIEPGDCIQVREGIISPYIFLSVYIEFVFSKMQTTPRIGFWLDNSNQTPQQTVETILNVRKPV